MKKGLHKIFVILIINKSWQKILLINRRSRKVMEGFGLVSKRGGRIYKEGLFPSEWFSRFASANHLAKDFETSHFPESTSVWLKNSTFPASLPSLRERRFFATIYHAPQGQKDLYLRPRCFPL